MIELDTLKLLLDFAVIPVVIFGYKLYARMDSLEQGQRSIKEQNSKEHIAVIQAIKDLGELVRASEKDNRTEHKELGHKIHELEKTNQVEHAILSNGGKL